MAITVVQHVGGSTGAAATSLVVANALTVSGNTLVLFVGCRAASQNSVSSITGGTWVTRTTTNTGAGFDNLSTRDDIGAVAIAANGLTINVAVSGSIEYDFWELAGVNTFESNATPTTGNSTAPTVSYTPGAATDILLGVLLENSANAFTSIAAWTTNYTTQTGVATSASSSIQSGILLPAGSGSQTYNATITSAQWAAAILAYTALTAAAQPTAYIGAQGGSYGGTCHTG